MLSKRYELTEVDRRTLLHVISGTLWSTSSETQQEVEIYDLQFGKIRFQCTYYSWTISSPPVSTGVQLFHFIYNCMCIGCWFDFHRSNPWSPLQIPDWASVTIMADFSPEFNPPFRWRCKHQTKIAVRINNLVSSEFPNRSNRSARSFINTLNRT